jgi:hypothetical protein
MPEILYEPGALCLGSWRRASWKMEGVILPIGMFLVGSVPAEMACSQGKGARRLTRLSGEMSFVSRLLIIAVTRAGVFVMSLVIGSQMEERLVVVGSSLCLFLEDVVFKIDLRASRGILMNIASRAEPYLF